MVDIASIKTTDRVIEITHPATGENIGIRVRLVSIDDEKPKKIQREITNRRLQLDAKGKNFKADEVEENWHNLQFASMLGWDWYNPTGDEGDEGYSADAMPSFNGEIPEFNRRNVFAVFKALPWFASQIGEATGETKAFFDNSKPI